jgi:predicted Zn-dependent protease with MMP-like domain
MKITRRKFDAMLEDAIAALPEKFARWLDEVPVIVDDDPPADQGDQDDEEGTTLGLFDGLEITGRSAEDDVRHPDQIFIYRRPLIDMCDSEEQLAAEIRKTLLHELGHYAGFDEDDLEDMGYA